MKSYFKSELARAAGVSYGTFYKWLQSKTTQLTQMGVHTHDRLLPPKAVQWICQQYGIDLR